MSASVPPRIGEDIAALLQQALGEPLEAIHTRTRTQWDEAELRTVVRTTTEVWRELTCFDVWLDEHDRPVACVDAAAWAACSQPDLPAAPLPSAASLLAWIDRLELLDGPLQLRACAAGPGRAVIAVVIDGDGRAHEFALDPARNRVAAWRPQEPAP
ncbi:MAG: hypothetical protein K1X88_22695 [Nannocystaceae bacterium]|nr:hypothetical protein [Nannocystaceae bacterium]